MNELQETTTATSEQTGTPQAQLPEIKQTPHELAQSDEVRRGKHNEWKLIGLMNGVPVWGYDWTMRELNTKYPPAKLRALRAERGVGSSKVRKKAQIAAAYRESLTTPQ